MLRKVWSFYCRNGAYTTVACTSLRLMSKIRGIIIGLKSGSKGLYIGPRAYIRGLSCITIGANFTSAEGLWLEATTRLGAQDYSPRIVIGDNVNISKGSHIAAVDYVEIGSGVLIGSNVLITDHGHGSYHGDVQSDPNSSPATRPLVSKGSVIIRENVWIGDGAVIMPGSFIGEGSIIGANSVVTNHIPPFTIAAGAPARCIKEFDHVSKTWKLFRKGTQP
jgi:lipopolysaccharide O-acetyltransferase